MLRSDRHHHTLLRIMTVTVLVMTLLAGLALPTAADGEKELTHVTEKPAEFLDAEFVEFEDYDDAAGEYFNSIDLEDGYWFDYVYLKMEADLPFLTVPFIVDTAGNYEFLIEIMAYETYIPRTALLQVDDGEKVYCRVQHDEHHLVPEYFTGFTADLNAGIHSMTIYLGDDFDDVTVKSIFFDRFYFIRRGDAIGELPEVPTEVPTEAPTEAPTESPTEALTEVATETATEALTSDLAASVPSDDIPTDEGGCASVVGGMSGLILLVGAVFVGLKKRY